MRSASPASPPVLSLTRRTAVYGPVCTVVWEGRAGNRSPYPDLVVEPPKRPRYTLDELLAQCDRKARRTKEEREWLDNKPVGRELI